jgi:hypothetical protein
MGKYLYALVACSNLVMQDVLDELVYHTLVQWKLDDEIGMNEIAIRDIDIVNIAKIAGVFQQRIHSFTSLGSIRFTENYVVNDKKRGERGLYDMDKEMFRYVRTHQDNYSNDISNEATSRLRMTFIPDGTKPVGYLPYGKDLVGENGEILWENILNEQPVDIPSTPFYGEKYLTLENTYLTETFLDIRAFKILFECLQRIRYNGPTIANFLEITNILGKGYMHEIEIIPKDTYYFVYYKTNTQSDVSDKIQRLATWQQICNQKFKLFFLECIG